jgi:hypothetical protein
MTAQALEGLHCNDPIVKKFKASYVVHVCKEIIITVTVITPPTITNQGTPGLVGKPYYRTGPFTVPV